MDDEQKVAVCMYFTCIWMSVQKRGTDNRIGCAKACECVDDPETVEL